MKGHPQQVPTMRPEQVADLIRRALPDAAIDVRSEDDVHFSARIISATFSGRRPLQRHQLVYQALGTLMGGEIHALSIEALTPDEARV
jgi:acid stress-induced BolA-like protein IbaG/YrbA